MDKFCSRASRLFSGNPSALFGPDGNFVSLSGPNIDTALNSPYQYQFDTNQVPDTQFWHIDKLSILIYNPDATIGPNTDLIQLLLMPNQFVGSQTQDDSGDISGVNPSNLGIQIPQLNTDLINGASAGMQEIFFDELPIEVPPKWFLRVVFLDDGTGAPFLPAGTQVYLRFMQQIIPVNFASLS